MNEERGHKIASYYRENISGTKLDHSELGRILMDSHRNDILLDPITRAVITAINNMLIHLMAAMSHKD